MIAKQNIKAVNVNVNLRKLLSAPQKPRQGDQLIHQRYTKSSPQLPKGR